MRLMVEPDHGDEQHLTFDGQRYADIQYPTKHVGSLLDAHAVHPNGAEGTISARSRPPTGPPESRIEHVFGLAGLTDAADRHTGGFSLGMFQQRLGLATALLGDPETLIRTNR